MSAADRVWRERGLRNAVLSGDEVAWRTWYDESFAALYAYVLWRCGGLREHADDVVQETWLVAVRRIAAFDPMQAAFASWLRGIAGHVLRNYFRKAKRQSQLAVSRNGASKDTEQSDRAERIARALSQLPERYEAVLRAKYLDGQSVADVAAAWHETPKAIESLLTRARQAFREAYDDTQ